MEFRRGEVAVVTGGAKGIGEACARLYVREGAEVAILDWDEKAGLTLAGELGEHALFFKCDVSRAAQVEKTVGEVAEHYGRIDILVNNAGIQRYANAVTCSEEDWDLVMAVNLKSAFLMAKYVIPHMRRAGAGVIVNVASAQSFVSSANVVHYTTAKSAMLGLTRSLAVDFAPEIRAVAVCPGTVDTPLARDAFRSSGRPEEMLAESARMHLLERIAKAEEIAEFVVFLSSGKASFATGQAFRVDGGLGVTVPGSLKTPGR